MSDVHDDLTKNLESLDARAQSAGRVVVSLMVAGATVVLYAWSASDAALITNLPATNNPLSALEVSFLTFGLVVPIAMLGVYLHLQVQLQRFWECAARLPRVLPDGLPTALRLPWPGAGIVGAAARWPTTPAAPLGGLQFALEVVSLWYFVPGVMVFIWGRYLVCHVWWLGLVHSALAAVSLVSAWSLQRLAGATIAGSSAPLWVIPGLHQQTPAIFRVRSIGQRADLPTSARHGIVIFFGVVLLMGVSSISTEVIGWPRANLRDAQISVLPADLHLKDLGDGPQPERREQIRTAKLPFHDLRHADAQRAVFVGADLRGALLSGADLGGADLRWADLSGADLSGAILRGADLRHANVTGVIHAGTDTADVRW
jgi:uncharacterized protein YjbI with pentapeptide repeats